MSRDLARMIFLFLLASLVLVGPALAQCPMCKRALEAEDPEAAGLARGFYWGILLLVAAPFVLLGFLGGVIWNSYRKARLREPALHA